MSYPRWEGDPGKGRFLLDGHTSFNFGPNRLPLYEMVERRSPENGSMILMVMGVSQWRFVHEGSADAPRSEVVRQQIYDRLLDDVIEADVLCVEARR